MKKLVKLSLLGNNILSNKEQSNLYGGFDLLTTDEPTIEPTSEPTNEPDAGIGVTAIIPVGKCNGQGSAVRKKK